MRTSISAIGMGAAPATDPAARAARSAAKMVKELDTNQDGSIDKKEFVTGLTAKGVSAEDAAKQFDAIDTQKTGSISKADISSAIQSGALKPPPRGRPAGGGDGDRGGGKPAGGVGGAAASKTYDPADTNQDGKVSEQEALVYSQKQSQQKAQASDPSKLGNNVDQMV